MTAMLSRFGVYDVVGEVAVGRLDDEAVRVALDATIASFAIGETSLEGVRRLATPTASLLLQATSAPSPDTLRSRMDALSVDLGAVAIHLKMLRRYLDADRQATTREPGVFYVDNHLRPYTGKHVIRKGWRMQDKRVRPGVSDYYVHDADGRPLFRIDVPSHDSLSTWMMAIVVQLRAVVGDDDRVLLAFDRGGAFPETMASLREAGCEFVTYERSPFPKLPKTAFTSEVTFGEGERAETLRFVEAARTNLKKGRGRVRRISVLGDEGRQLNILASSTLSAERLIAIMRGRWCQENGFKHGNERWGINHLDARKVVAVDPDEVMPNPARRRLDIARRAANVREGDGRNKLVRFDEDDPRYTTALRQIAEAILAEQEIDTPPNGPEARARRRHRARRQAGQARRTTQAAARHAPYRLRERRERSRPDARRRHGQAARSEDAAVEHLPRAGQGAGRCHRHRRRPRARRQRLRGRRRLRIPRGHLDPRPAPPRRPATTQAPLQIPTSLNARHGTLGLDATD